MKKFLLVCCFLGIALSSSVAQDANLMVKVKEGPNPDIYIDGKKYDYAIVDLLDQNKIASVNVIKGKKALEEYNAPNGVILIKTKSSTEEDSSPKVKISSSRELGFKESDPMVIIDGKKANKEVLSKLSPDDIDSINVLKGEQAIEKYKSPNGVVIVKTKSGKKD